MCDVSFSRESYQRALDTYASEKKGKHALVELDRWFRSELRDALQSRHPKYITKEELVKVVRCPTILAVLHGDESVNIDCNQHIVKWKLTRGTWRPKLLSYAEQHAASTIFEVSSAAFEFADVDSVKQALEKLMELKGMGAATSSAVLSAAYPNIPFMSDEMLMAINGKKEYTIRAYMQLYSGINNTMPSDMCAEEFECALWTKKHLSGRQISKKREVHTVDEVETKIQRRA